VTVTCRDVPAFETMACHRPIRPWRKTLEIGSVSHDGPTP